MAVVFPKIEEIAFEEIEIPEPGPDDVLIDVEYTTISNGTERWCLTGNLTIPDKPPLAFPHLPGYQAGGVVRAKGEHVKTLRPGDRVFSRNCTAPSGWRGSWWGGHTRIHVARTESVIALPERVSTREASALLLAQVGFNGASKPRVSKGYVAAVIGEGLVGQYAAQVLRSRGVYVVMAGLSAQRLEIAARYSADEVYDNRNGDFSRFIREKFPEGVDIAIETASKGNTVQTAIDLLRPSGQLVLNGFYPPPEHMLDWHQLRTKELTVYCPNSRTRDRLERTLPLIEQGHIKTDALVTHEFPAEKAEEAYKMLLDPDAEFLGIVLRWKKEKRG
jgi:2-desacetyl-2-hydroxyethyl bacteriochlorophyllide A dehydrogenase